MRFAFAVPLVLLLLACNSGITGASVSRLTALEVDPTGFDSEVVCGAAGGPQRYVATLWDLGDETSRVEPYAVMSSPPTPCRAAVRFSTVALARSYVAELEGYDETELQPLFPGSKTMVHEGEVHAPRWRGYCGGMPTSAADAGAGDTQAGDAGANLFESQFLGPLQARRNYVRTFQRCSLEPLAASDQP